MTEQGAVATWPFRKTQLVSTHQPSNSPSAGSDNSAFNCGHLLSIKSQAVTFANFNPPLLKLDVIYAEGVGQF